jgi:PIN domain
VSRTNYIFVDFENVQETDWERIADKPVKVVLVLGVQQKNLPVHLVRKLLKVGGQVQLVEAKRAGKNALDMVLAHYVGAIRVKDPEGYFHIVSKDTGYDSLVGHLQDEGAHARRHASFSEIPILMNAEERVSVVANDLKQNAATRPRKLPALQSKIQSHFGRALSEADVAATVQGLVRDQTLTLLDSGEVKYAP